MQTSLEEQQCPPAGCRPRLPASHSKPRCRAKGAFYHLTFAHGGVSVLQPWREFTHVPNHGFIPTAIDGTAAHSRCRCWVLSLWHRDWHSRDAQSDRAKKPIWVPQGISAPATQQAHFPSFLLSLCWLRCNPACRHISLRCCPQPQGWAVGLSQVTNTRTPGLLFIYCRSPVNPWPSLWALHRLRLFVSFFTHFSGRCIFTSPVCFECRGGMETRWQIPSQDHAVSPACTTWGRGCESAC